MQRVCFRESETLDEDGRHPIGELEGARFTDGRKTSIE
jgi:hypothetical protein